ncbi:response regulator transcription factor [Nakamurella sp. YIM 132084]|uniref:Response regulator transcription factor n=1 Tax=Nakamurella leprariae TaxID=2803911 RepID=A0A938YAA4_9ACTN|nr:response regulator transcription factor [Nakamurella leprariae]
MTLRPAAVTGAHAVTMGLTPREREVLQLMSDGLSNREIGRALFLAEDTVKTHTRRLYAKLSASDRAHAVAIGFRKGVLR